MVSPWSVYSYKSIRTSVHSLVTHVLLPQCMIICFVAACAALYFFHASSSALYSSSLRCVVPTYFPGLVGGTICEVTCLFLSQSLLFHTKYECPWSFVWGSAHALVCNCLLISLLAVVILIRVGRPSLRVMSVRSISSSLVVMVAGLLLFCSVLNVFCFDSVLNLVVVFSVFELLVIADNITLDC